MPSAERMLGEYTTQLARERRTSWRSLNAATPARPEVMRLTGIVAALARLIHADEREA